MLALPSIPPVPASPDVELARRCAAGDRAAQRALFAEHKERVHRIVFRIVGSNRDAEDLIQDAFLDGEGNPLPQYFQPRPSAAGYDSALSLGSNLGPTNPDLISRVEGAVAAYRELNGLEPDQPVPVDAVTASASGLDPHISVANARLQARRVADERGLEVTAVLELVDRHTDGRSLGFLGEPGVNVLELNLALDAT